MNILAINSNVGASICLIKDGNVVFALQEERLTRKKNQGGLPITWTSHCHRNRRSYSCVTQFKPRILGCWRHFDYKTTAAKM